MILNRGKKYYENKKQVLREHAKKINDYLKREKNIKIEYGRNIYQNLSEEKN